MPNDPVLVYYLLVPCMSQYIRLSCSFTHWVAYISRPSFCNPKKLLIFQYIPAAFHFLSSFLSSLFSFSPFLGCQTPSKDDNLEDERLKPFPLEGKGCWGWDLKAAGGSPVFHAVGFDILVPKLSFIGLKLFDVLYLANTWQAFRV